MKRCVLSCLAVAAGLVLSGPALADDNCLTPRQVQSWNNLGPHAIVVRATGGHRYRLDLAGTCLGLNNAVSLAVASRGTGLCVSSGDYITYRYHELGEQRCMITSVEPYTPEGDQQQSQPQEPSGY
jgi:Family of unknown function (DUF6491)